MSDRRKRIQKRLSSRHTAIQAGKHIKVKDSEGHTLATVASTPGGARAERNEEALLRRLGIIEGPHKTVTLNEEAVERVLGSPSRRRQSLASWCHDAIMVGKQRGLRTPKSDSMEKAINSLTTQLARLRRERTEARFKPWVAELLLAGSEPPGESPPVAPIPEPEPAAAPATEPVEEPPTGTNRQRLEELERTIGSWDERIVSVEAGLAILVASIDEIHDVVTRPNELRGQLAVLLRSLLEPA